MAPTHCSVPPTFNSGPSRAARPVCATAGKGGYVAQLEKTAVAIKQSRHASKQPKDLLEGEPINKTAPAPRHPRKKKTGKKRAKDTPLVNDTNSDPFDSDSQPIIQSRPDGRFGLQPRASTFVGRQTLGEYERDHPKNDLAGGMHHKLPDTDLDSNDRRGCMAIDNEGLYGHRSEDRDDSHQMDVDGNEQGQLPLYSHNSFSRKQSISKGQDDRSARETHQDRMINDPVWQDDAPVQPPRRHPQPAPQQFNLLRHLSARDSTQPHRHVPNAQWLQERALPSPPISRSNSNGGEEHNHDNATQVQSAVCRGDEHADTDYNLLGRNRLSTRRPKSPNPEYLSNVRDGIRPDNNHMSRLDLASVTKNTTWQHCVIKKAAQNAIPSGYAVLVPISAVSREARTTAVKAQATALLQDAEYLHGTPNEQGKKAYFGHAVLK
ncbi:hypothetical protein JVT61DRAFT_13931 [Boletus reticuloceps]|uniref:Uncharacterized protein n=1 Tax=Boletus reticuloceps TaxID=495285 RepID=A0A8I3AD89_9AGAM|nr:hypothetical protein JVT61DRAFT_13931 [Boletus reticuloceps]